MSTVNWLQVREVVLDNLSGPDSIVEWPSEQNQGFPEEEKMLSWPVPSVHVWEFRLDPPDSLPTYIYLVYMTISAKCTGNWYCYMPSGKKFGSWKIGKGKTFLSRYHLVTEFWTICSPYLFKNFFFTLKRYNSLKEYNSNSHWLSLPIQVLSVSTQVDWPGTQLLLNTEL